MQSNPLTLRAVFRFWLPLSLTWQMMSIEQPVITSVVSRLPDPKINLAAFGVAFAWALIIESPVISLLSASAALAKDPHSFRLLRKFMWQMNLFSTVTQIVFILPPVFAFVTQRMLNLPPEVAARAYEASWIMIPWSPAIGFRRFYQGIMIRGGNPGSVAIGTMVRVISMLITALSLYFFTSLPGASVACATLVAAVSFEAIATRFMASHSLRELLQRPDATPALSYPALLKFYIPLTLTIVVGMGMMPMTTLALGHASLPIESLAVLPVVNSLVYFILTSALAVQETTIVLVGEGLEHRKTMRNFAWILGGSLTMVLTVISYSQLGSMWFSRVSGLPESLVPLAFLSAQMAITAPLLRAWESYQRALMVKAQETAVVTGIALVELVVVACSLFSFTQLLNMVGAVAAPLSVACGALLSVLLLIPAGSRAVERHGKKAAARPAIL